MHSPEVVVFDLHLPIPRVTHPWRKNAPRWAVRRRRYSPSCEPNSYANKPMHWFLRPAGWEVYLGGRQVRWYNLVTVWHNEPRHHDSGTICKGMGGSDLTWHNIGWALRHVRHLSLQFPTLQGWRARLFDRCTLCGRKGRPNISNSWDGHHLLKGGGGGYVPDSPGADG